MLTPPPPQRQPDQCFDTYNPIIAFSAMPGLCRVQLCFSPSFEGFYSCFLLLWPLQSPACQHCPICAHNCSFRICFFGLASSWTMPSLCSDLCTHLLAFELQCAPTSSACVTPEEVCQALLHYYTVSR